MKTLIETIQRDDMEALSKADPSWLKDKRREAWAAWEKNAALPKASGSRFLDSIQSSASWDLPEGGGEGTAMLPAASFDSEWGALDGSGVFSAAGDGEFLLGPEAGKAGVKFLSLARAVVEFPHEVRSLLFSLVPPDEGSFSALNAACFDSGTFLYVPRNVKLRNPLRVQGFQAASRKVFFPRTLVWMGEGAQALLIEEAGSLDGGASFASTVVEIELQAGANLSYIYLQDLNRQCRFVQRQRTRLGKDAGLYSLFIGRGASSSSVMLESLLRGAGAGVDLLGLALANGGQEMEIRTRQSHLGPAGSSDSLVKSILRGKSRFCFDGVVEIGKEGARARAFQNNPNLMLSDQARVQSIPTLEILCEDVSCKHAASVSTLDDQERFYLMSRGVAEKDAENLIVEGFGGDLAQRLPQEPWQENLAEMLAGLSAGK